MRVKNLNFRTRVWALMAILIVSEPGLARTRFFSRIKFLLPAPRTLKNPSTRRQNRSLPIRSYSHSPEGTQSPTPQAPLIQRPIQNTPLAISPSPSQEKILNKPQASPSLNSLSTAPNEPSTPKSFGRTISDAFRNRPKLFQTKLTSEVSHPFTKIFCEDPYRMVCEVSMDEVNAESWPNEIFPRQAEGAFGAGKKILSYLTEHYFDYNEASKRAVLSQLENTQILITNTAGPMAFSTPPHIEVPPTYWNLFSVFHELGHMIDFKVTFPTQKAEIIQVIRHTASTSNLDQLDAQISAKQAEITADKITAKGFAFLADPQIKNLGYQPMSSLSLLKTLKSALGFLCNSPGGTEHPSGKFRINYISRDPDLRTVMGCPVAQTK